MIMITEMTSANVEMCNGGGKIKRPSFKSSRGGGQNNVAGRGYHRAVRVKVPSTVVTELASKFNAVVVDANSGDTARDIIKKVNKSLAQGAAVRATVEKFESATENKHSMVVVRTNSDRQQAAAVSVAVKEPPSSLVKKRMEQFQAGKKPPKPNILTPKPNLANLRREGRRQLHRKDSGPTATAEVSSKHLMNKHKRLSIARDPDAQLESVLNCTPPSQQMPAESELRLQQQPVDEAAEQTVPSPPPKIQPKPNSSFLHGQTRTTAAAAAATDDGDKSSDADGQRAASFPHQTYHKKTPVSTVECDDSGAADLDGGDDTRVIVHDYNYIGQRPPSHAIYEELCDLQISAARSADAPDPSPLPDVVLENTYYENSNDDHYTTIEDGSGGVEQNIYEYVNNATAQKESRKRPADEDGRYETVQAPPTPPPKVVLPVPVFDVPSSSLTPLPADDNSSEEPRGLSDSSSVGAGVDILNSIYNTNPPSETTSSGITSDSDSALRNNKFYVDEEWVDVDNTSDELQEIIVFRQKPNISDTMTSRWSIQVQKQLDKANETKENTNTISQDIPEGIYADYDSFESDDSWDDYNDGEKINRVPYPCENRDLPPPPSQQNIDGIVPLVKKARNRLKNRWSLGSLNRMWKLSVGNLADLGNRSYDSKSDKSIDKKNNSSSVKCNSLTSSTFYLNGSIGNNIENGDIRAPVRKTSRPPSSLDSRRLSVARPSSPPPPPPVKRHSTGTNAYDSISRLNSNSKGRPASLLDKSNTTEPISENGRSNQGPDLYMRFADEPLYQFYNADISERSKSILADDINAECDGYEEISSITSRPSALELITPCPTGHGQHRSLWCEVPEVKYSGIIDTLTPRERKLQEAKFELITSEASYFKSLTVLEKHFVNSHSMNDVTILSKNDRKIIFGNVSTVRKCCEKLLTALEKCWQDNILLTGLCEILYKHSKDNFEIFVKYCSNQIYIDRTLKSLREKNLKFNEALQRLESDAKCQSLSLHSFLMLPMQRITRLPLLVDAILSQMDSSENSLEYKMCELTLASLNTIVQNCNESTRKLERYEEMLLLSQQFEFSKKEMKAMSVASSSRWLVRSGSMLHLISPDAKLTFSRKSIRPTKLYFFLFNDMFFIAKRKSDENYTVVDYCARNFVQMVDATELVISSNYKNLLMLTILENHEGKTIEMLLSCDSESSKKRWIEAMSPPISSNPDETLYNEWDCPQVFTEHPYTAIQPDELALQKGDIVKVMTKMNDGWYHGERIRDGEKGWFPGNYTSEIASQHARAKNLKQRYRLLAMSGSYLQSQQDKIKKK